MKDVLEQAIFYLCNNTEDGYRRVRQKGLVASIRSFLTSVSFPDTVKEHVDLLKELIALHEKHRELSGNLLVRHINLNKYPSLKALVLSASTESLPFEAVSDFASYLDTLSESVSIKQKSIKIIETLSKLEGLSDHEIVDTYRKLITSEYIDLIDKREIKESIVIDPNNTETLKEVITVLTEETKSLLKVPVNIPILDQVFLDGGFEEGRVYLFASSPGLGKSTLMINLAVNMAKNVLPKKIIKSDKPPIIVYYTLENNITETYERFSRVLLGEPVRIRNITDEQLDDLIQKFGSLKTQLMLKYMKPGSKISDFILDISTLSETNRIVGIFVDYLDLFTYDLEDIKERRRELGAITFTLKILGIMHNCPVISPTQINTEGYSDYLLSDKVKIPTMRHLDESRQKAQNADFVGLMFRVPKTFLDTKLQFTYSDDRYKIFGINVDKNRDNPIGVMFGVADFSTYTMKFFDNAVNNNIFNKIMTAMRSKSQQ